MSNTQPAKKQKTSEDPPEDYNQWKREQVKYWALEQLFEEFAERAEEYSQILFEQDVSGKTLLRLTKEELIQDGMPRGPATSLSIAIEKLKKDNNLSPELQTVQPGRFPSLKKISKIINPCLTTLMEVCDFNQIRSRGLIYVDKTEYIANLFKYHDHVFLTRPRRFGKSMLVSTLRELFLGNRELFSGLYIDEDNIWNWKTDRYPVIHLDLSKDYDGMDFPGFLKDQLLRNAKFYQIQFLETDKKEKDFKSIFQDLISSLCELNEFEGRSKNVVVLIDEYDIPVLTPLSFSSNEEQYKIASKNLATLCSLFTLIKSLPEIRFSFVTGSSRLAKSAVFSGDNARTDITFNESFNSICGFSLEEILKYFEKPLALFCAAKNLDQNKLKGEFERMYDGYNFGGKDRVYNPFSVVSCIASQSFDNFWVYSGSTSSIIRFCDLEDLSKLIITLTDPNLKIEINRDDFFRNIELESIKNRSYPANHLLLQAGYLSLRVNNNNNWSLCIPNDEIRNSAIYELLWLVQMKLKGVNEIPSSAMDLKRALSSGDITLLYNSCRMLLANVVFPRQKIWKFEDYYQRLLEVTFRLLCKDVSAECNTSDGSYDLFFETLTGTKIMLELKKHEGNRKLSNISDKEKKKVETLASKAMEQARKYGEVRKANIITGWVINTTTRTLFDPDKYGDIIKFEKL